MAKLTAVFGLLLIGNGIYGYTAGESQSPTALILTARHSECMSSRTRRLLARLRVI